MDVMAGRISVARCWELLSKCLIHLFHRNVSLRSQESRFPYLNTLRIENLMDNWRIAASLYVYYGTRYIDSLDPESKLPERRFF